MTNQSIASVIRQVAAVAASIYGVLSASVASLHLPTAISAILTAIGPIILAIEHYVGDPSTGTPTAPVVAPTAHQPSVIGTPPPA
jgi:hypothetical protein